MIYLSSKSVIESHKELVSLFKSNLFATNDPLVSKETSAAIQLDDFEHCDIVKMENGQIKIELKKISNITYINFQKSTEEEIYYTKILEHGVVIDEIVNHLKANLVSRRCVYNFWEKEFFLNNNNGACINYIYFRYKNNKLYLHSHMRANDLIDCYILDVCFLYFVGKTVSNKIGVPFAGLTHFVDSLQLYKKSLTVYENLYVK